MNKRKIAVVILTFLLVTVCINASAVSKNGSRGEEVKKIQTKYRYQILTRYVPDDNITSDIFKICDIIEKDVSIFVEINPNSLR